MSSLTACAHGTTATAPRGISDYCLIAKPITFSEKHGTDAEDVTNKFDTLLVQHSFMVIPSRMRH
jgi:hypothetical protein